MSRNAGKMIGLAVGVVVFGLTYLGTVGKATAQFESSAWQSNYGQYQGPATAARIQFQGQQGTYNVQGSNGQLNSVNFYRDQNTGAVNSITGNWAFAGQNGWFQFKLSQDGQAFTGTWGYGAFGSQPSGYWNGNRIGGPVSPPGGPVPPPGGPVPPPNEE